MLRLYGRQMFRLEPQETLSSPFQKPLSKWGWDGGELRVGLAGLLTQKVALPTTSHSASPQMPMAQLLGSLETGKVLEQAGRVGHGLGSQKTMRGTQEPHLIAGQVTLL
jgi:hypothetical protein